MSKKDKKHAKRIKKLLGMSTDEYKELKRTLYEIEEIDDEYKNRRKFRKKLLKYF